MNEKVKKSLKLLEAALPLKKRLETCPLQIQLLYKQILMSFITDGYILPKHEMAKYVDDVENALSTLVKKEMVILSSNGNPIGAYPFTMEDRETKILINGVQVNAMCALDALAISPMYNMDTQINSHCRMTGTPIYLSQSGSTLLNKDEVSDVFVCINWEATNATTTCANSLCMEMFFVSGYAVASDWEAITPNKREVLKLIDAVTLAKQFFVPLIA